jgi:glycosyltransferase involved in cell wall biosynthesis
MIKNHAPNEARSAMRSYGADFERKSLRHCMIVQNYYPFSEVRVRREAEALLDAGHSVDVICRRLGSEPKYESNGRLRVHRLTLGKKTWGIFSQLFEYLAFAFLAFLKVTRLHLKKRFNVVQAHNLPDFLVFAALVPRLSGSRVFLDIHDLMPEFYCSRFNKDLNSFAARILRWQEYLSCHFAHHVITVTDLWRETLISRGVPEKKVSVVMNVADPAHFKRAGSGLHSLHRGANGDFRLVYHGTIAHRYGVDLLLQAVRLACSKVPGITLRIHGRGDYTDSIRTLIKELDLESRVELTTNFLSADDLSDLLESYDVGIVPYRSDVFTDGILPTKLMEYVALGVPAIVAKTNVIAHYFGDDAVEFFRPGDVEDLSMRICELYYSPERRKLLAAKAERFNTRYNWSSQKAGYVRLVETAAQMTRTN